MIHICYAMNDKSGRYSKFTGTSMLSVFENTREKIRIHMLHDDTLSTLNRKRLVDIVRKYDQQIVFYNVENLARKWEVEFKKIPVYGSFDNRYSIAAFYRYFIPILLPDDISKTIYLDADTIVNLDIKRFWDTDIGDFPIAAYHEGGAMKNKNVQNGLIPVRGYINNGTLMLNLDQLRDESKYGREFMIKGEIKVLLEHPSIDKLLDQEALSVLFMNNMAKLPFDFNHFARSIRKAGDKEVGSWLVHYATNRGLLLYANDPASMLFWKHFIKTPFCTVETFENLHTECVNVFNDSKKSVAEHFALLQKLMRLTITRPRVFFMNPAEADEVKSIFGLSRRTIGIDSEKTTSIDDLLNEMKSTNLNSKQKSIYYIHLEPERYSVIKSKLESEGFIEYEDFFNSKTMFNSATKRLPQSGLQALAM